MIAPNELKRLLQIGAITQSDLADIPSNELANLLQPASGGFVRNEDSGQTLFLNGQPNGISDTPSPAMFQPPQSPQQPMRVAGFSNSGIMHDLPSMDGPAPQIDYSRPAIDTPKGRGYYGKDGAVYVKAPDGSMTKILLGYDPEASYLASKRNFDLQQAQAQIAHTQEQIAASQQARTAREGLPGMGVPQTLLEKQFGKAPEGKRWNESGQLEDIPGGDGGKMTESQSKAAGMATRAQAAHDLLTGLENRGITTPGLIKQGAESVPLVGGALAMGVNSLPTMLGGPSKEQQSVEQAQRDFVNAVLRPESGASISQSEFDNARRQYFPQPGDTPETIAQKQQARAREINALAVMAGNPGVAAIKKTNATNVDAATKAKAIFDARRAISLGADPAAVRRRLMQNGITDAGL